MWVNKRNSRRSAVATLVCAAAILGVSTTAVAQIEDAGEDIILPISGGKVTISQSCFSGYITMAVHPNPQRQSYVKLETSPTDFGVVSQGGVTYGLSEELNDYSSDYKIIEQRVFNDDTGSQLVKAGRTNCPTLNSLPASRFEPIEPTRVLDTRPNFPPAYSGPAPTAGTKIDIPGSSLPKLPADAIAVSLQVTAVRSQAAGFIQVFPAGTAAGSTSNVNLTAPNQTVANAAVVKLGTGNGISVYTSSGADLLIDVTGYFRQVASTDAPRAGRLVSFDGVRALDTRPSSPVNYSGAKPNAQTLTVDLAATGKVPAGQAAAAVVNVASVDSVQNGFVQVGPTGKLTPGTSSILNPNGGGAVAALTIVPVDANGKFDIYTNSPSNLLVDVVGYFTSENPANAATRSGLFVPTNPSRVIDTRLGEFARGIFRATQGSTPGPGIGDQTLGFMEIRAASQVGGAAWYNVTAIQPTGPGFIQLGGRDLVPGKSSNVNYGPDGRTVSNAAIAPLYAVKPQDGAPIVENGTRLYNVARSQVAVDAAGYFIK